MTLFNVCTWWSIQSNELETGPDSWMLHCCRIHLNDEEKDFIVIGSHSGHLKIYQPSDQRNSSLDHKHQPTDVILELKLSDPILSISSGSFITAKDISKPQISVLRPNRLTIYDIKITDGIAVHGNQTELNPCFVQEFGDKYAYSMCQGNFGGTKNKEFICVTFMDGTLKFFEQDGISYEYKLPGTRNIPSELKYISTIDSFVSVSSACDLECYRYQDFISHPASDGEEKEVTASWSVCLGEYALDFMNQQISNSESVIVILGEHSFFCISHNGKQRFIKKLNYSPICFYSFVSGWYWEPNTYLITAIITDSSTLMIYKESTLMWAAHMFQQPIAINRFNMTGLAGAIVTLSDSGNVHVGYLGSDPQLFNVPPLKLDNLNFESSQKQLIELEDTIRSGMDFVEMYVDRKTVENDLSIKIEFGSKLEKCTHLMRNETKALYDIPKMCIVTIAITPNVNIEQIQINCDVDYPIKCLQSTITYNLIKATTVQQFNTCIYVEEAMNPASSEFRLLISFTNSEGICRIIEKSTYLPVDLFFIGHQKLQKDNRIKITLSLCQTDSKIAAPTLFNLFAPQFNIDEIAQAIGFKSIYTGSVITIVSAKNSNRFRVQSDNIDGLAIILEAIINRIEQYYDMKKLKLTEDGLMKRLIKIEPIVPKEQILLIVDEHHSAAINLEEIKANLDKLTIQMKLIERRFLEKIEDKSPGINGISMLLKDTELQIKTSLRFLDQSNENMRRQQIHLSTALSLIQTIIKYLSNNSNNRLKSAFVYYFDDWLGGVEGWEKMIAPAMETLASYRTTENLDGEQYKFAGDEFNYSKFKEHLTIVLDNIGLFEKEPANNELSTSNK